MIKTLNQVLKIVSNRRKITFLIFIFITFLSSFIEAVSIGMIIPFIGLFLDYDKTVLILSKFDFFNLSIEEPDIYYLITIIFVTIIILSTIFKIFQGYFGTRLSNMLRHEISSYFYFKLVNLKYLNHNDIDENNLNSNIQKIDDVSMFVSAFLSFVTNIINIAFLCILLIILDIKIFVTLLSLGLTLIIFNQLFKNLLIKNGKLISINIDRRVKVLNNTIGYLSFIIINNLKDFFYKNFTKIEYQISKSNVLIHFFLKTPNLIFISLVTIIISTIVLFYKINLSNEMFVAKIAIFTGIVVALMRSMPQLVNLQASISSMRSKISITYDVLRYISKIKSHDYFTSKKIISRDIKKMQFKNLNYSYEKKDKKINLISNLNLIIHRGEKIFIYGKSGSGKTTLLKLILGLLKPHSGEIFINSYKVNYSNFSSIDKNVSYVSQNIFLSNASFLDNLTLGLKNDLVELKKVVKNCKITMIHNFISKKKKGYNSEVSHDARNISGGQKQRIGIARALIRDPEILVLDESTNSMDSKTEIQILKNIKKEFKQKTIICISHKRELSKLFDKCYVLKNNRLINIKNKHS